MTKVKPAILILSILVLHSCDETGTKAHSASDSSQIKQDSSNIINQSSESLLVVSDLDEDIELYTNKLVPSPTARVDELIHSMANYNEAESFARASADTLSVILNSTGFKRAVLNTSLDYSIMD